MLERIVLCLSTFALIVGSSLSALLGNSSPQVQAPPLFVVQCAGCHGEGGVGTARGPALTLNQRVAEQSADQLDAYLQRGNVAAGMPSSPT
jgi:mono/diheme cytochrome c family protein